MDTGERDGFEPEQAEEAEIKKILSLLSLLPPVQIPFSATSACSGSKPPVPTPAPAFSTHSPPRCDAPPASDESGLPGSTPDGRRRRPAKTESARRDCPPQVREKFSETRRC